MSDQPTTENTSQAAPPSGRGSAPESLPRTGGRAPSPQRRWSYWLLPSIADIFFLVLLILLTLSPDSGALLHDADTGWHIRNGEIILATHQVPHVDPFSYTKAGQPWFAWEWLYDLVIAAVHHVAGLNGVVLFTAAVIAATFALLFRFLLRRSGNFVVAAVLTLLAIDAAEVHMLARPHVLSWLFTVLWLELLFRFEEGRARALLWLPPLMLVWVNVHGGFLLGLALLALFLAARGWHLLRAPDAQCRRQFGQLGAVFLLCAAVTLLTPYGYKLYGHVYGYLSNTYLMNSISEFMSPDFHQQIYRCFEVLILLSPLAFLWGRSKVTATDVLLLLAALHAGLYSARNIPMSAMMIAFATARPWAEALSAGRRSLAAPRWGASLLESVQGIAENMGGMERRFRGHILALAVLGAAVAVALNGGRIGSAQLMSAHFSAKRFPVKAAGFIAAKGIRDGIFEPDNWSGYLIYRLYPRTKFYFDDRHDFYGAAFCRDYVKIKDASWQWSELLRKYRVRWVLIPPQAPLATVLKENRGWRLEYDDGQALLFSRRSP